MCCDNCCGYTVGAGSNACSKKYRGWDTEEDGCPERSWEYGDPGEQTPSYMIFTKPPCEHCVKRSLAIGC